LLKDEGAETVLIVGGSDHWLAIDVEVHEYGSVPEGANTGNGVCILWIALRQKLHPKEIIPSPSPLSFQSS
jgi:hypothetical protein